MGHSLIDAALKVCKTRYRLAKLVGTNEGNLSNIYLGRRGMPPALAAKIAAVAGVDAKDAAAIAMLESVKDPAEREALERAFYPRGAVAMLLFSIVAGSTAYVPNSAEAANNSARLYIM